ncbi:hypothetical protein BDV96DRAFT_564597 [Lophiotrema nucula]|uniref:DUF2293 domain-containing protein n=1 Tax=Lophiotrema nucula TaxID=690887 RepID=A0A6A5ZR04_9PLEO|nr:hypothetical protein BDV96DRAFT_564597 [Lophiotrema nucula]
MTRVHTTHHAQLRSHRSSAADRTKVARKKKPYKVVLESVTQEKKALHTTYSYTANPPRGYSFVPSGHPDLTEYCKDACRKRDFDVHIVSLKPKNKAIFEPDKIAHHVHRIGHHFPDEVVAEACDVLGYYVRHGVYRKSHRSLDSSRLARTLADYGSRMLLHNRPFTDVETKDQIRAAVRDLFPKIPVWDLNAIVNHAFQEGTGRVGNAKDVPLARRVQLAVVAHIRHNYTEYDKLLKVGSWAEARVKVEPVSLAKLKEWRDENDTDEVEETFREVIVLDDDEDDSDVTMSGDERDSSAEIISSRAPARELPVDDVAYVTRVEDRYPRRASAHGAQADRMAHVPSHDERFASRAPAREHQVNHMTHVPRVEERYAGRAPARELQSNDVAYVPRSQERYTLRAPARRIVLQPFSSAPTRASYPYPTDQLSRAHARPLPPTYDPPPHRLERPLRMVEHGQEFKLIPIQQPFATIGRGVPAAPPPRRTSEQDLVLPSVERDPQWGRRPAGYGY